jgi:hypothetical protein
LLPLYYSVFRLSFPPTRLLYRLERLYPQAHTVTAVMLRGKNKRDTLVVPQNLSLHFLCGLTHVYGKLYILVPNF